MSESVSQEVTRKQQEIKASFAALRKRQWMLTLLIFPLMLLLFAMFDMPELDPILGMPRAVLLPLAITLVLAFIVFTVVNWRCPSCRRYLGREVNPSFCAKCGAPLK